MRAFALLAILPLQAADWQTKAANVMLAAHGDGVTVRSANKGTYTLESADSLPGQTGSTFVVSVRLKVDLHTKALPELASFDAAGNEIPTPRPLDNGPNQYSTDWQAYRRLFAAPRGTVSVKARVRAQGEGVIEVAALEFKATVSNSYETGAFYQPLHPSKRRGLVLDSWTGIVNRDLVSASDNDGDGKWALIRVDLDKLSEPERHGVDWRTKIQYRVNEIYWSEGSVLKSDSIRDDRTPTAATALHYRTHVRPGPYRVIINDPGRAVALSTDGVTFKRYEGGQEIEIKLDAVSGQFDLWFDAAFRDPITAGPVYFDYVRLYPMNDDASNQRLLKAALRKPASDPRKLAQSQTVAIQINAPPSVQGVYPVRVAIPIPQGELADVTHALLHNGRDRAVPAQIRAVAWWPDGSIKWLHATFLHHFAGAEGPRYRMIYGESHRALPHAETVRIRRTGEGLAVDTGTLRFVVPKTRFGIIQQVEAGKDALQTAPIEWTITEAGGRVWKAQELPVERLEIEQAGPLHAVIRTETKLPASGATAQGFTYKARIHVYAGSPYVQLDAFVANTDEREKIRVESIKLTIRPDIPGVINAGIDEMEQQHPKSIREPDPVELALWDSTGGVYDWIQGVGKTHRICLGYKARVCPETIYATASPEWYAASGAFGNIPVAARSPLPAVEATLKTHMDKSVIGQVGLGFENYGDHSSSGYVAGTYLWDNNEYDLPAAAFGHFARTGDFAALKIGLASALHYLDVDTIHYSREHADWAGAPHTHSHGDVGHHTADGPGMNHAGYTQGLLLYSYLTGDPIGIEGSRNIAGWCLRNITPESTLGGMERALGHPLMTLTDTYEATGDPRYLKGAARLVDWALKWQEPGGGGFKGAITESPAYQSGSPFCSGVLTAGLMKFNQWAKLPEIDEMLERQGRWLFTDVWMPPNRIMNKGGPPSRAAAARPQNISPHLRLMDYLYERTQDPLFLALPLDMLVQGFGENARPFGTRDTGLVFNYVPWFLGTLVRNGNPTADAALRIEAKPPQGRQVCFAVTNSGSTEITGIRATVQARLTLAAETTPLPTRLAAGKTVESCTKITLPEVQNLNYQTARMIHPILAVTHRRTGRNHFAFASATLDLSTVQ